MKNVTKPILDFLNSLIREGFEKFGRYYSSYRGFVADVNDPDSLSRVKLVIPQITGKQAMDYWAWPKHNFSGNGYGSQILPKKGDMVWVEFEMGNPRKPVWLHGHHALSPDGKVNEKPQNLRDPKNYWFKTPEGNLIQLDDTNKWIMVTFIDKMLLGDSENPEDYDDFLANFNGLKSEFNKLKADHNSLVAVVNANAALLGTHTHAIPSLAFLVPAIGPTIAGTTGPGVAGSTASNNTSDIEKAKNKKILSKG